MYGTQSAALWNLVLVYTLLNRITENRYGSLRSEGVLLPSLKCSTVGTKSLALESTFQSILKSYTALWCVDRCLES